MKNQFLKFRVVILFLLGCSFIMPVNYSSAQSAIDMQNDCLTEASASEIVQCYEKNNNSFYPSGYIDQNDGVDNEALALFRQLLTKAEKIIAIQAEINLATIYGDDKISSKKIEQRRLGSEINTVIKQKKDSIDQANAEYLKDEEQRLVSMIITIIIGSLMLFSLVVFLLRYTNKKNRAERHRRKERERIIREKNEKLAQEARDKELRQVELEKKLVKDLEMNQYRQLRKDIEAMPLYEHWRQEVFKKFGRKCANCGCSENLEIDHRFKSFGSIIREYKITNTTQAYECAALWDPNNGAPLCKTHHDETKSSVFYKQNNSI